MHPDQTQAPDWTLYRLPCDSPPLDMDRAHAYTSERQLLNDFHVLIQDCQVLTGYNINGFDLPCLFTRLLWLQMYSILRHYSSVLVGTTIVTTFQKKMVLDLYFYFRIFSSYDLPGFKLDDVARMKLNETKVPVQSTGLWSWYTQPQVTAHLLQQTSAENVINFETTSCTPGQFGTFKDYMQYCLKDSF
ncbi:DNA polymerase [Trichonephila clavipes]|nr:DNA polymerase [Trichonephila clavipes]